MGGDRRVLGLAKAAAAKGDDRWAATLLGHLVRAVPADMAAKEALAKSLEQLAYQSETGPWRDFYLSGALELRSGVQKSVVPGGNALGANLQVASLLDTMSVRVLPERAGGAPFTVAFIIPDAHERHLVTISNGVMLHEQGVEDKADATLIVPRLALIALVAGQAEAPDLMQKGVLKIEGDPVVLQRFLGIFQQPVPGFPLVTR